MKKIVLLAIAMAAFAIPASASASPTPNGHFLFNGEAIEGLAPGNFLGSAAFHVAAAPTEGIHCQWIHLGAIFETDHGHVDNFIPTNCTTTSGEPAKHNLPADPTKIGTWTVEPNLATSQIRITGVHINNKVTHWLTTHLVLSESTLKGGTVIMTIPAGQTTEIETVTLSDSGATVESGIPPAEPKLEANISGHLTSNGRIGIGEGNTEE